MTWKLFRVFYSLPVSYHWVSVPDGAGANEFLRLETDSVAMPAGAEAHVDFGAFAARLKSCPVTKHEFFRQ
jgi:hypothetical protein